jgi:uncharacterized protein
VAITTQAGDTVHVSVEVADTQRAREVGLADRPSLAPDAGMLLLRDTADMRPSWMKDTLIPLSAAWFDASGEVVWIQDMQPCEADPCELYTPPVPAIGVLEVNRGALEEWGVRIGDTITVLAP